LNCCKNRNDKFGGFVFHKSDSVGWQNWLLASVQTPTGAFLIEPFDHGTPFHVYSCLWNTRKKWDFKIEKQIGGIKIEQKIGFSDGFQINYFKKRLTKPYCISDGTYFKLLPYIVRCS
jgi:hypothetical protein